MKQVRVTFNIEPSDPDHDTGVTSDHFDKLTETIMSQFAGEDINCELIDDGTEPHVGGGPKS